MTYGDSASGRLAAVRAAIDRCLAAQSYTVRGRQKVSAELTALMKLEERLVEEVAAESAGGVMANLGRYVRPT